MSKSNRSKRILDLCDEALLLASNKRPEFLQTVCHGDEELKQAVETLLKAVEESGSFLQVDEKKTYLSD